MFFTRYFSQKNRPGLPNQKQNSVLHRKYRLKKFKDNKGSCIDVLPESQIIIQSQDYDEAKVCQYMHVFVTIISLLVAVINPIMRQVVVFESTYITAFCAVSVVTICVSMQISQSKLMNSQIQDIKMFNMRNLADGQAV